MTRKSTCLVSLFEVFRISIGAGGDKKKQFFSGDISAFESYASKDVKEMGSLPIPLKDLLLSNQVIITDLPKYNRKRKADDSNELII